MSQFNCLLLMSASSNPDADEWLNITSATLGVSSLAAVLLAIFVFQSLVLGLIALAASLVALILGSLGVQRLDSYRSYRGRRRFKVLGILGIITSSMVIAGWAGVAILVLLWRPWP